MKRLMAATVAAAAVLWLGLACSSQPIADRPAGPPNVVLLVLDEFPSDSLLGRDGRIDSVRYPNFAALAGDSVWFRNAASSYDSTTKAVPLILDGMRPAAGTTPDRRGHPRSLFDMFARARYRMVASEEASALCPPSLCRGGLARRPAILPNLVAGRPERYERWLRSIRAERAPDVLDEAPPAPARALPLPALGRQFAAQAARPAAGHEHHSGLPRRVSHPPQRAALSAPARVRGPADRPAHPAPEGTGHLRQHADRGYRRPRHLLGGRGQDSPRGQPVERSGTGARAVVRQAPGRPARHRQRLVRAHAGRAVHDRRRARPPARLPRRRAVGLQRGGRAAPPGQPARSRPLVDREHLRPALGGAAPPCGGSPPARVRLW